MIFEGYSFQAYIKVRHVQLEIMSFMLESVMKYKWLRNYRVPEVHRCLTVFAFEGSRKIV